MNRVQLQHSSALQNLVKSHVESVSRQKEGLIHIGLPGGRSAKQLVLGLLALEDDILSRIRLYLLDERLSGERNSDTLLEAGLAKAIEDERFNPNNLISPQVGAPLLKDPAAQFDLIYLGVGEDGHVASLFPGSYPAQDTGQTAHITASPKPPLERVSFTYKGFLDHAHSTPLYLLFLGEGKREPLRRLLSGKEDAKTLPCAFFAQEKFPFTILTDLEE